MIDSIANRLRVYLRAHLNAADTLEGITEWWLTGEGGNGDPEIVLQALERLVDEQALIRVRSPDGRMMYARRRH